MTTTKIYLVNRLETNFQVNNGEHFVSSSFQERKFLLESDKVLKQYK